MPLNLCKLDYIVNDLPSKLQSKLAKEMTLFIKI